MPNSVINAKTDGLRETGGDAATLDLQISDSTVTSINSTGITVTGSVRTNTYQDASGGNTATINSMTPTADSLRGFRNRIINGGMVIDQRNAGAAVTSNTYCPDRWRVEQTTDGAFSAQQVSDAPTGFVNSLKWTVTTADASLAATQYATVRQGIEGFNTADLMWGTANAATVTLSFWVKSSLTGTFGGVFGNSAFNRSYPFTYTISSANTWEQKTVTITGDTTGTWEKTNSAGIQLYFGLGSGSTYSGTAGAWTGSGLISVTGAVNVMGTLNATWFITGVQLEVGSTATPFERRPYGTELMLCQRYYQGNLANGNTGTAGNLIVRGQTTGTGSYYQWVPFSVQMRAAPTMNVGTPSYTNSNSAAFFNSTASGAEININVTSGGGYAFIPWRAEIEL